MYFVKTASVKEQEGNTVQTEYILPMRKRPHGARLSRKRVNDDDDFIVDDFDELALPSNIPRIWYGGTVLRRQSVQRSKRADQRPCQFTSAYSAAIGRVDAEGRLIRSQKQAGNFDYWLEEVTRQILHSVFANSTVSTSQTMLVPLHCLAHHLSLLIFL